MSECVVRMEMPKNCRSCPLCMFLGASPECALKKYPFDTVSQYYYTDKKPSNCPIICSLPEEHGRLIDASSKIMVPMDEDGEPQEMTIDSLLDYVVPFIESAVPAERSET